MTVYRHPNHVVIVVHDGAVNLTRTLWYRATEEQIEKEAADAVRCADQLNWVPRRERVRITPMGAMYWSGEDQ